MSRVINRAGLSTRPPKEEKAEKAIPSNIQTMLLGIDVLPNGCAFSIGGIAESGKLTFIKLWESSAISLVGLKVELLSFLKDDYCKDIDRWIVNIDKDSKEFKVADKDGFTLEDMRLKAQHKTIIYVLYTNPLLDNLVKDLQRGMKGIRETINKQYENDSTVNINYSYVIKKEEPTALENGLTSLISCINDDDFELQTSSDLETIQSHLKEVDLDAPIPFPTKSALINSLVYSVGEKYYRMKCGKDFSSYDVRGVTRATKAMADSGMRFW